jgi:hypothetical protein
MLAHERDRVGGRGRVQAEPGCERGDHPGPASRVPGSRVHLADVVQQRGNDERAPGRSVTVPSGDEGGRSDAVGTHCVRVRERRTPQHHEVRHARYQVIEAVRPGRVLEILDRAGPRERREQILRTQRRRRGVVARERACVGARADAQQQVVDVGEAMLNESDAAPALRGQLERQQRVRSGGQPVHLPSRGGESVASVRERRGFRGRQQAECDERRVVGGWRRGKDSRGPRQFVKVTLPAGALLEVRLQQVGRAGPGPRGDRAEHLRAPPWFARLGGHRLEHAPRELRVALPGGRPVSVAVSVSRSERHASAWSRRDRTW